jgi:2'-5' RNA ligase
MANRKNKQQWDSKRTFVVLNVPEPVASKITLLRSQYQSWRVALPVEITLAGSSGIGVLRYHESEMDDICDKLDEIARISSPILTRFSSVTLFPGTRVFYYRPDDSTSFIEMQSKLIKSGLRFERSPIPFTPHCTIADLPTDATELPDELKALALPDIEILLDTLSVYQLDRRILSGDPDGCRLHHQTKLRGQTSLK